jgi:hypothetical protein
VKRRLALGNLSPKIRDGYRNDLIDGETLKLLTLASKAQQKEWLALFEEEVKGEGGQHAPRGWPRVLRDFEATPARARPAGSTPTGRYRDLERVFQVRAAQQQPALATRRLWSWSRTIGWRRVKKAMTLAGVIGPQATAKGLRHSFGVAAFQAKVPPHLVQRWLGTRRSGPPPSMPT